MGETKRDLYVECKNSMPKMDMDKKKLKHQVEFKHAELVKRNIIVEVDKDLKPSTLKKLVYAFKRVSSPQNAPIFEVIVKWKMIKKTEVDRTQIKYMTLLEMQARHQEKLKLDRVT